MPDYKENVLSGGSYQRAKQVVLNNFQNEIPSATFAEEIVYQLGDEVVRVNAGTLTVKMTDPNKSFPLRDYQTGEIIPDQFGTYGQIYVLLYGAYWDAAIARDTAPPPPPDPPPLDPILEDK